MRYDLHLENVYILSTDLRNFDKWLRLCNHHPNQIMLMCACLLVCVYVCALVHFWVWLPLIMGFSAGSAHKESACNARQTWVRSLGWEDLLEKGTATHSAGLETSMDCIVHGITKSQGTTEQLSLFHFPLIILCYKFI